MTRRRVMLVVTVSVVIVAAAVGGSLWWSQRRPTASADPPSVPVATARVVRMDLSTTTQLSGTLGYAGAYTVSAQGAPGTVTALPQPGQLIRRGQPAYELDGAPVFLFYGARPSWRPLADGVTPGPDVRELEQNLTALGYANATNLSVDTSFTWATNLAIRRWQQTTGQPVTGQLALGRVVYEPGPIQILSTPAAVGDLVSPGQPVLQASSTTPTITVPVPAAQTYLVHVGDAVTVTLPSGTVTGGEIDSISAIASQNQSGNNGGGGGSSNSPSGPGQASVPAVVSLTDPAAAANLDQAPVTVNITDRTVTGVLAVPITALVALAGGGYGVWVDTSTSTGTGRSLVAVTPGLFATTLVQVTAPGLQVGDKVEVPSQ